MTTPPTTVLVVDDDRANLDSVARIFQREGLETLTATNGTEALELLRRPEVSVMVTDLMMPGMDGQELLKAARTIRPDVEVVLMTAYGTVETAVAAMKDGAYDFITKPLKRHSLVKSVQKALERHALVAENRDLKAQLAEMGAPGGRAMVGQSPAFRAMMDTLRQAAPSTATVLLMGESGTGKELAARALHELSAAGQGPLRRRQLRAPCPRASSRRSSSAWSAAPSPARWPAARAASSAPAAAPSSSTRSARCRLSAQVKLLRVLQEGEIERLGGTQTVKVDVRLVAATNKDLQSEVAEGRFREDLYYRLNVVEVRIPALASRREDIPLLADALPAPLSPPRTARRCAASRPRRSALLENYAWPGNVRELEHAVERAVVLAAATCWRWATCPRRCARAPLGAAGQLVIPIGTPMEEIERRVIHETLRHTKGDKTLAARLLGIAARTIYRKLERELGGLRGPRGGEGPGSPPAE